MWRSRTRPILLVFFGPFILAGFIGLVFAGHLLSWGMGLICGAAVGAWITMRETPPHYIEKWHDGAEGERKTEKALKKLEKTGLRVVHDIQARYGNYDHIAVGPSGVFLLETKNLLGTVVLREGVPHLRRRLDPQADTRCDRIRPRALAGAANLKEDIQRETGHRTWVQAVVVFWSDFPEELVDDGRCVFVQGAHLTAWLEGRPFVLDQRKQDEISALIERMAEREPGEVASSGSGAGGAKQGAHA
jgi:Nuclease-related domain